MDRYFRHERVRVKIQGSLKRPRLCVFRSNKYIYAQVIDDEEGKVLVSASSKEIKSKKVHREKTTSRKKELYSLKLEQAFETGLVLAQRALKQKITKVSFDRGGYKYHGRVKALAEGAREGGLVF